MTAPAVQGANGQAPDDQMHDIFARMPRADLKALLMTPQFDADQRAYWFYVFKLKED